MPTCGARRRAPASCGRAPGGSGASPQGICHYCRRAVGIRALTLDHVVPLIRGGRSVRGNMVASCKDCNSKKQSLLPWEWDAYLTARAPSEAD